MISARNPAYDEPDSDDGLMAHVLEFSDDDMFYEEAREAHPLSISLSDDDDAVGASDGYGGGMQITVAVASSLRTWLPLMPPLALTFAWLSFPPFILSLSHATATDRRVNGNGGSSGPGSGGAAAAAAGRATTRLKRRRGGSGR